jgi:hypothetical protein
MAAIEPVSTSKGLSAEKLCELSGLTDRRHRQLADEGYFPPPIKGDYQPWPTIRGMFRYFREQLHKKGDSLAAEQKLKCKAQREKTEVETEILRQAYIKKSDIAPMLRNVSLQQRAALQNKLENELPPKLAGLDPIEIRQRMAAAVDEICALFGNATKDWTEPPGG